MSYFVTGGTGFIGRHLLGELVKQGKPVYVLVRAHSRPRLERIARDLGEGGALIVAIEGDLSQPLCGLTEAARGELRERIRHFFHLGALYDLSAAAAELEQANVAGTRHALALAARRRGEGSQGHKSSLTSARRKRTAA